MDWASVSAALGGIIVAGYSALKAHRADKQTRDTGDGWAKEVIDDLEDLKKGNERIEGKIDRHVEAHAQNDVQWRRSGVTNG